MKYDHLVEQLGEFGPYQRRIYFLSCLPAITAALQTLIPVFTLAVPDHRCAVPDLGNDTYIRQGDYHQALINHSLLWTDADPDDDTDKWGSAQCKVLFNRSATDFDPTRRYSHFSNETRPCDRWVYDTATFDNSFVTMVDMVCDDKVLKSHANMIYMVGLFVGSIGFGVISDAIGRKSAVMLALALHITSGVAMTFSPNFAVFAFLRFVTGLGCMGLFMCSFVLSMEFVGVKWRTVAGIGIHFFWCVGLLMLDGVAYWLRDWKNLQLATSCFSVIFISLWWLLPESPRWLISKGRISEAKEILEKIARVNNKVLPKDAFDEDEDDTPPKGKLTDVCSYPVLSFRLAILFVNWLVVTMVYYGITLNVGSLGGNIYLNFALNGMVEVLGNVAALVVLPRWGRKKFHCFSMIFSGVSCLCLMIPAILGKTSPGWVTLLLSNIGKFGATGGFTAIYVFSAELFPTALRNTNSVVGSSSMVARVGGMVAPYIADLGTLVGGPFGLALPFVVFGASSLVAGVLALTLPETLNTTLPETIQDAVDFGKAHHKYDDDAKEKNRTTVGDNDGREKENGEINKSFDGKEVVFIPEKC